MSSVSFTDGRRRLRLGTDPYYSEEMTSLAVGLASVTSGVIDARPAVPTCPGAPGC
jgi:hypothetical protein